MSKTRKLSDHIPFDIQSEFIKRLPVKSLLQFRSVSKQWKSFIDDPKFIKNYHINHTNPQHHLLLRYKLNNVQTYTSIVDNNTFPKQKFPLTAPESLSLLRETITVSSVDGLLCFYELYGSGTVVIWNPTIRKSVSIVIPWPKVRHIVCFGVCRDTCDPTLVKITDDKISWVVEVFTLSTRVWRTVYKGAPFKSCYLAWFQVFVDGVLYIRANDYVCLDDGVRSNFVISFDLKSEKFGEVCLPEKLVHNRDLNVTKVNESLGLLEYYKEGGMKVCGVWKREDGANKTFSKIFTIKVEGIPLYCRVLAFRNNGEVVMELDNDKESRIAVYEPFSGNINEVGINEKLRTFDAWSYMETLLFLNESDCTIH